MSEAIVQIGEHKATLEAMRLTWSCPTDQELAERLNRWIDSRRTYQPDHLDFYSAEAAKAFGGKVLKVDRLKYKFDRNAIY